MTPTLDTVETRQFMVDGQIRPNRVSDPRILAAMRELERERFLPPGLAHLAYVDQDVKLGGGRFVTEPLVIARMVQLGAPQATERVLLVASGTGYGAALLALCGADVVALEEDAGLRQIAAGALAGLDFGAGRVRQVAGPLAAGWAEGGPYDLVLIEGAVQEIPAAIAAQIKPHGRLVAVLAVPGAGRQIMQAEALPGGLRLRPAFDCNTPFLPALLPQPGFVF